MTETSQNSVSQPHNNLVGYTDKYFLGSGDQPDQNLGAHKLNGDNFLTWNRGIRLALGAKNKLTFIDGKTARPPSDSEELHKWLINDYIIQSWLLNSMDKMIVEGYDSIVQYYSKLKRVWDEIQLLDGFPYCDCGALDKCSCGILKKVLNANQKQKLIQLLVGLDRGYDNVTTNILSMDPLSNVNRAYYMLLQVERQIELNIQQDTSLQTSAFVSMKQQLFQGTTPQIHPSHTNKRYGKRFKYDKSLRKCDYCKKTGHTMGQCFKLTGVYPNVDSALVQAVYKEMMKMVKGQAPGSLPLDLNSSVNFAGIITTSNVNSVSTFADKLAWIIDTAGTADHMIWDKAVYASYITLPTPIKVGLPHGTTKLVTVFGIVNLTNKIILQHVLLIPDFNHNLLSVSKLLSQNNLVAIFTSSSYQFQDLTTKEIQAIGSQQAGLYKFNFASSFSSADTSSSLLHISNHVSITIPTLSVLHARL
ncbi:uncharacterized protein LOC125494649 [Beta vulgaris subsp. vulgaris]|uniref:uncharacterized protein LOC125494649 n=1 Tax=Beta vulgaris subsp. vulgaris TaxID=3555 RepID=UPI0020367B83|nr:uncharacterized protein LOC125494649 [Beta vulgaris subsp. vulgaris]